MNSLKRTVAFLAIVIAGVSCLASCGGTDPVTPDKKTVSASPASVSIDKLGGNTTVSITSNSSWTVSVAGDWMTVTPTSGNGNTSLTISADANMSGANRSGQISISTGESSASVSVSQEFYDKYSSISTVRALYKGSDVKISEDIWIKGTIVSNYRHSDKGGLNNNTSQKGIVLQDDSAGIQMFCSANNTDFAFGDVIEVSLKGQTLSSYNGLLQINGIPLTCISKIGTGSITPKEITAKDLLTGNFESQYVAVKDVQVVTADLGKTFVVGGSHTSIGMESKDGDKFILFSSSYSSFKDEKVPEGSGTLKGIACIYGEGNYQIILAQKSDVSGLTGARFSSGSEFVLSASSASVDGFADTVEVSLVANVDWTATSSDPDFKVSPDTGNSESLDIQTVRISYGRNPSTTSSRTAVITFTTTAAGVAQKNLQFTITQAPYEELKSDEVMGWMELPKVEPKEGFVFISHTYSFHFEKTRNFSFWYDCHNKYSTWLAYPLYTQSTSTSRTDNWEYDPKVPKRYQPQYYKALTSGYARGHQVPSGDRLQNEESNSQTFYFTNITAQNNDLNGGVWVSLEDKVRSWASGCDTLYVVTGALVQTEKDKDIKYVTDNIGEPVAVPKAYYKVVLRYKKGGTVNGGYDGIGFIYENRAYTYTTPAAADAKSIDEMEKITGFDFFHNLPDDIEEAVEKTLVTKDWGF
jgi:DNA/RNA endonuclease G, NUC1